MVATHEFSSLQQPVAAGNMGETPETVYGVVDKPEYSDDGVPADAEAFFQTQPGYSETFPMLAHKQYSMKQRWHALECLTGCEVKNEYDVVDPTTGEPVLYVKEESACCQRVCLRDARGFTMHISDMQNRPVAKFARPWSCTGCHGFACGRAEGVLYNPQNEVLAKVQEQSCSESGCCGFKLNVFDGSGKKSEVVALDDEYSRCSAACCGLCNTIPFNVSDATETNKKMMITKDKPVGVCACARTADAVNNFTLDMAEFPNHTSEDTMRMLAASFMIDFGLFERKD